MLSIQLLKILSTSTSLLPRQPIVPFVATDVPKKNFGLTLGTWDILCGQDKRLELRPGNMKYQQILSKMRNRFHACGSKTAKKKLVKEIDEFIQSYGGRFLRMDDSTGKLRVMSTAESRNKISRTLRENVSPQKNRKVYIVEVSELDVLCGRGKQFRELFPLIRHLAAITI